MRWFLASLALLVAPVSATAAGEAWLVVNAGGGRTLAADGQLKLMKKEGSFIIDTKERRFRLTVKTTRKWTTGSLDALCAAARRLRALGTDWNNDGLVAVRRTEFIPITATTTALLQVGDSLEPGQDGVVARRRGSDDTIAGKKVVRYVVAANGEPVLDLWISDDPELKKLLDTFDMEAIQQLERCGIGPAVTDYGHVGYSDAVEASDAYIDLLREGWPMKKRRREPEELLGEVRTVNKVPLRAEDFEPEHRGYRRVPVFDLLYEITQGLD